MTRSPDKDDRAVIVRLAEQGTSVRRIAKITLWSRPTVSKILAQEGFDPKTGRIPTTPPGASTAPEGGHLDFAAQMKKVDEETEAWWTSLSVEEQDRIISQGPPQDRTVDGGFLDKAY
jgi:hypothetical protein